MNEVPVTINCAKCSQPFEPDFKTRGCWICPSCKGKNPNLKRHYRSVGDLYILWLGCLLIFSFLHFESAGIDASVFLSLALSIVLVVTIFFVYKSSEPWNDALAKLFIWITFGMLLCGRLIQIAGMAINGNTNFPHIFGFAVGYTAIFMYLLWLHFQTRKYMTKSKPNEN
jgi:hypothetical protein